ncbi:MAG: hypothetical protein ABDI19_09180 [Armatimonadota bacterium]
MPTELLKIGLTLLAGGLLWRLVWRLHARLGWYRPNFRGEVVPARLGVFPLLIGLLLWCLFAREQRHWLLALGYGVLGFLDDQWGQHAPKGMRGHLRALLAGQLTTGWLKFVGGLALGIAIAWWLDAAAAREGLLAVSRLLLSGLMIALWANFFNLLDVRPGRAGTLFLVLALPCVLALHLRGDAIGALMLLGTALALFAVLPTDRAGKGMLGDTGSNLLGSVLGTSLVMLLPLWVQGLLTLALLLFHLWAERHSLTEWIERHPLLRRVDRLTGVR